MTAFLIENIGPLMFGTLVIVLLLVLTGRL